MTSNEIYARVKENEFVNAPTHRVNVIDENGVIRLSRPCWGLDMAESIAADREGEIDGGAVEIVEQENRDEIQAYWDKENTETPNPDNNTPTTMNANETSAICPLDFPTAIDAYNYALAHQYDANPLAVAIESNNHTAPLLRSLVINGVNVFGVWCDAMDDTATSMLYTTEAGAREAMAQVEANDREAGIYEPDYYKVIDLSKYFAA